MVLLISTNGFVPTTHFVIFFYNIKIFNQFSQKSHKKIKNFFGMGMTFLYIFYLRNIMVNINNIS